MNKIVGLVLLAIITLNVTIGFIYYSQNEASNDFCIVEWANGGKAWNNVMSFKYELFEDEFGKGIYATLIDERGRDVIEFKDIYIDDRLETTYQEDFNFFKEDMIKIMRGEK